MSELDPNLLETPVVEAPAGEAPPVVETPPAEKPTMREALEKAYDASAEGKPLPVEGEKPVKGIEAAKALVPGAQPTTETPPTVPLEPAIPERLKAKLGEKWQTFAPEVKAAFREYETSIGRMADKYGKAAKDWEQAEQTFAPYREMVRSEGGTFHTAVANLFETARLLRQGSPEQKQGLLVAMAQAYKIPLPGAQLDGQGHLPPAANLSPELLDRINRLEQRDLTAQANADHNLRAKVDNDLNAFTSDPKNAYVQEPGFLDTMASLIKAGKAEGLEDSYKQAAWLHENTRNAEIAKITAAQNAPRVAAAQRARQAGVSVNGNAPGTVRLDPSKMSLRDTLAAAYEGDLSPD